MSTPFYIEENVFLSPAQGEGFFCPQFGEKLENGRYTLVRKLGRGEYSSTWLAFDHGHDHRDPNRNAYRAIKVLSVRATIACQKGIIQEMGIWQSLPPSRYWYPLENSFYHDGPWGQHLCLVSKMMGMDLFLFRKYVFGPSSGMDLDMVKQILRQVSRSLRFLHECNIVHADIKASNILLGSEFTTDELYETVSSLPPPPCYEVQGHIYTMWQSAPVSPPADESGLISAQLIDLGSAQLIGAEPSQPNFYPLGLRSPELLLRAGLGYEADIWAMGHLAFELLTGQTLFQVTERYNPLSSQMEVDLPDILAQMMEISGDSFSTGSGAAIKKTALDWSNFFDIEGSLRQPPNSSRPAVNLDAMLIEALEEPDLVQHAASFIRSCLSLNPRDRLTAEALANHCWLEDNDNQ